ncbi:MAG: ABC transporter substrate-binding protein [Alphaproteobacteria bacterium]
MRKNVARLTAVAVGAMALAYSANVVAATPYEQLLADSKAEMAKTGGKFRIGFDWTVNDAKPVFAALEKEFPHIKPDYKRETGVAPFQRYFISIQQNQFPPYEMFDVASEFEKQYWDAGFFVKPKYDYKAINDSLPAGWPKIHPAAMDPEGKYIATVAQMRGIAYNVNMVKEAEAPKTFADCADPKWKGLNIIDGRNKAQALMHDPSTGTDTKNIIKRMKDNGVVITNGQAQVLARVVSGEFGITCYINYHTTQRMIDGGEKTLKFRLGEVVPVELATRVGVPKWTEAPATVQLVAVWLATKGQPIIDKAAYRGFPWVEGGSLYEQAKGKHFAICSADCFAKYEDYNKQFADLLGIPYVKD